MDEEASCYYSFRTLCQGGITGTVADPRLILKKVLESHAVNIILCHNHPSGNLKPNKADEDLAIKIREAAGFFDIKVIDYIIVSHDSYFSFAYEGMIPKDLPGKVFGIKLQVY